MVAEFTDINRDMEKTGKFKMQRKKLFQLVGKANSNLADVILKLGLFERYYTECCQKDLACIKIMYHFQFLEPQTNIHFVLGFFLETCCSLQDSSAFSFL